MGLKEEALSVYEAAVRAEADRQEAKRRAEEAARQREIERFAAIENAAVSAFRAKIWQGQCEITDVRLHSAGGDDGVGYRSWPAVVKFRVDGMDMAADLPRHLTYTLRDDKTSEWVFTYRGKRFNTLEGFGKALAEVAET